MAWLSKRKQKNTMLIATLKNQGLLDTRLSIKARVNLFNAFIRSTLYYGSENYFINDTIMKDIRRIEGNFLKSLVETPNRCHTTDLMRAMGVLEPSLQLEKGKLSFYNRLLTNEFTCNIIKEEVERWYIYNNHMPNAEPKSRWDKCRNSHLKSIWATKHYRLWEKAG